MNRKIAFVRVLDASNLGSLFRVFTKDGKPEDLTRQDAEKLYQEVEDVEIKRVLKAYEN